MADRTLLTALEGAIKTHAPKFEVRFKNESKLMKIIDKILFFNHLFMTNYITTIGQVPYWPSREHYEYNPDASFDVLAHEFVHVMDYIKKPVRFTLGYLFPQILALPAVLFILLSPLFITLMCLSIISPWWLLTLLSLVALAPLPASIRKWAEVRGYGMSLRVRMWRYNQVTSSKFESSVRAFTGPNYYFMWPFEKDIRKELSAYSLKEDPAHLETDSNPAWRVVYQVLKDNGAPHE